MSDFVKDINVPTNDCISRQAAIELKSEFLNPNVKRETEEQTAIDRAYARGWNSCNTHWIDEISELPSAQPGIIRCKDCKHYQFADNRAFGMSVKMCEWFGFEDVDDDDFCSRAERKEE